MDEKTIRALNAINRSFYRDAAAEFTDEAALVEAAGNVVEIVPDTAANIKVTTLEDFAVAEALLDR